MVTTLAQPVNDFSTTLASAHAAGAGSLVLSLSPGTLAAGRIWRVTALLNPNTSTESVLAIFEATGNTGATLTGVTAVEGTTNVALSSGTAIEIRMTAKCLSEVQAALNTVETAMAPLASPAFTGAPTAPDPPYPDASTKIANTGWVTGHFLTTNAPLALFGDCEGSGSTSMTTTVVGLQTHAIATTAPTNGQVLTWLTSTSKWTPQTPAGSGDILSVLVNTPVSITGTTALTSSAFGKLHVCSGTSADYAVTLPSPTGNAGKFIGFRMAPALTKLVTLTHNASEGIDTAASRIMWANEVAILLTDGTDWFKIAGKSLPMSAYLNRSLSVQTFSGASGTAVLMVMDTIESGISAMFTSGYVTILRSGSYNVNGFFWGHGFVPNENQAIFVQKNASSGLTYIPNVGVISDAAGFLGGAISWTYNLASGDTMGLYLQVSDNNTITMGTGGVSNAPTLLVLEIPTW